MTDDTTPAHIGADAPLAQLRHLYDNLANGGVRDTAQAKRIAEGLLAPAISALESAALASAAQPVTCTHRIADARNPVVRDGYICVDCGALFAAADHDAAAPKAAQGDALDAARYRWLRKIRLRVGHGDIVVWMDDRDAGKGFQLHKDLWGEALDAAIDAARAAKEGGAA